MSWPLRMVIRIFPFLVLAYIYAGWKISGAVATLFKISRWQIRSVIFSIIIFLNLFPLYIFFNYFAGSLDRIFLHQPAITTQDYFLTFPFWMGLVVVFEIVPYFLSLDILGGIFRLVPAVSPEKWKKWKSTLSLAVAVFFVFYGGIKSYQDTYHVRLQQYRVPVTDLPPSLEGLSIAFISDIQVDRYTQEKKLMAFRDQLGEADGQLLLFGGDLVTRGEHFIEQGLRQFCGISAPLGRIACMGDHDHWANPEKIAAGLRRCGWTFLENQHHLLEYKSRKILVTGITHIYSRRSSESQLKSLFENAPPADLKIVLVHQPYRLIIDMAAEYGYHLILAGHTHGGQVVFRPFGFSLTPTRFENIFYTGYHEYNGLSVIVTNGVGLTLAPLRYQAPAEVTAIRLTGSVSGGRQ